MIYKANALILVRLCDTIKQMINKNLWQQTAAEVIMANKMKDKHIGINKLISIFIVMIIGLTSLFALVGCQPEETTANENQPTRTVVELNESNYWKYLNVNHSESYDEENASVFYEINGVLDFALYEDVVFLFDVIYYTDGQSEEEYQSYTMRIACNAAGDAAFETNYLGLTNVTVGKWLGADGELVSLASYNWKIHLKSVSGKVIYTA